MSSAAKRCARVRRPFQETENGVGPLRALPGCGHSELEENLPVNADRSGDGRRAGSCVLEELVSALAASVGLVWDGEDTDVELGKVIVLSLLGPPDTIDEALQ